MGGVCRSHENTKLFCRKDFGILRGPGISPHGYQGTTIWVLTSARSKQPTHNGQRSVQAQIPSVQASGPPESSGSGSFFWTHQSAFWWLHLLKDSSRYDHTAVGITSMNDRVRGWLCPSGGQVWRKVSLWGGVHLDGSSVLLALPHDQWKCKLESLRFTHWGDHHDRGSQAEPWWMVTLYTVELQMELVRRHLPTPADDLSPSLLWEDTWKVREAVPLTRQGGTVRWLKQSRSSAAPRHLVEMQISDWRSRRCRSVHLVISSDLG
jgi:hypothetical protein